MHFFNTGVFHVHQESFEERVYDNFRSNFKQIRQAYNLTLADMADILCLRSRSTLSELENGNNKKMLAMDSMMQLSKVFAVSLDWLFGYTDKPYCEPQIMDIEDSLLDIYSRYDPEGYMDIHDTDNNIDIWIPNAYLDYEIRRQTYSLPVRANICFLFHCTMLNELYDDLNSILRHEKLTYHNKEDISTNHQQQKATYENCLLNLVRGTDTNEVYKYKRGSYFTDLEQSVHNERLLYDLLNSKENAVVVYNILEKKNS